MCQETIEIEAPPLLFRVEKGKGRSLPVWTKEKFFEEVREHGAKLVVCSGLIHNLSGFNHPGGDVIDNGVVGTDATLLIDRVHALDKDVRLVLRSRVVAMLDDPDALLEKEDKDLRDLSNRVKAEGLQPPFDSLREIYVQLLDPLAVAIGGFFMMFLDFTKIGVLLLTCAHLRLFWWLHDGGHHGLFADKKKTEYVLDVLGLLFFGVLTFSEYRAHEVHHGFVNCLDRDWTSLKAFDFHRATTGETKKHAEVLKGIVQLLSFVFGVNAFWFQQFINTTGTALSGTAANNIFLIGVMSVRYYLFWYLGWRGFVPVVLAFGVAGFISCLNHVHMDKFGDPSDPQRPTTFLRQQVESTQSIRSGWLWTWMSGSLDYHIEHHLFPNIPSHRLPELREPVKALLAKHNIHYNIVPVLTAVQLTLSQFFDPSRDTRSFSKKGEATLLQKVQEKFNIYRWATALFDVVTGIGLISAWNHLHETLGGHPFLFLAVAVWNLLLSLAVRDGISALVFSELTPAAKLDYYPGLKDIKNFIWSAIRFVTILYSLHCSGMMVLYPVHYSTVSLGRDYVEFYLMAILMDVTAFKFIHRWMHRYTRVFKCIHAEHHSTKNSTTAFAAFEFHVLDFFAEHGCAMFLILFMKGIFGYDVRISMASYFLHTRAAILVHSCNRHSLILLNPLLDRFIQVNVMHNLHHAKPNDHFEILPYYHAIEKYRVADNILYDELMPMPNEFAYVVVKSDADITNTKDAN